ncbi:MAG: LysE family translocator [Proteobacteria bacterium]|nr:LysE family translocator [Pseudomonadota bacterium]MBU1417491.1 LysE family translocator [Pseudomonadota bacterium]MBU1454900.1 LysE family translocator [Pseudomonadota bacterium]
MELHVYLAFVVATTIMIALPGPSVLLTVAHSISFGWQRALATVAGATMGIAVQLIVAAIGLTSLLNGVAEAFEWLRWGGAAYLVYLGIKQWRSANKPLELNTSAVSKTNLFVQGLVVTIPNPKSLIFIAAFLPQFIDAARPLGLQFTFIVPTFLVITFTVTSFWALVSGKMSGFLQSQRAFQSVLRTAGGLMIVAGAGLLLARRGN